MPHSSLEGKDWSAERVLELRPTRVLDVGPGIGTYEELLRRLLPNSRWTAVEIHAPYVARYELAEKYDEVLIGDVRAYQWYADWDLVIFGDILEHLELAEAIRVWRCALQRSKYVLASLPIVYYPQSEYEGNVHETHRVRYDHELVKAVFPGIRQHFLGKQIGVYLAGGPAGRP